MKQQAIHKLKRGVFAVLALAIGLTLWSCKEVVEEIPNPIAQATQIAQTDSRVNISLWNEQGANLLSVEDNRAELSVYGKTSGSSVRRAYDDKQGAMTATLDEFDYTLGLEASQSPFIISYRGAELEGFCTYYHPSVPKELKPYLTSRPLRIKTITIGSEIITLPEGKDPLKEPITISLRYADGKLSVVK